LENNIVIESIIDLFKSINAPALVVLKTQRAGEEVDNGYGVDFDLPPFAVIHQGSIHVEERYKKVYEWQRENKTELLKFDSTRCTSIEALCQELKETDDYNIVWRRTK
jgi:hypothetical protein